MTGPAGLPAARKKITIQRYTGAVAAWCEQCGRLRPDATRDRARQHADKNRHTVRYVVEDITVYRPTTTGEPA